MVSAVIAPCRGEDPRTRKASPNPRSTAPANSSPMKGNQDVRRPAVDATAKDWHRNARGVEGRFPS